jgi:hypothetical protein
VLIWFLPPHQLYRPFAAKAINEINERPLFRLRSTNPALELPRNSGFGSRLRPQSLNTAAFGHRKNIRNATCMGGFLAGSVNRYVSVSQLKFEP